MIYNNTAVRRQDRLLPENEARALLASGEYGVLSVITGENTPYGIPISYAWDGENSVYLHSAPEGRKISALLTPANVSFCVVGKTKVIPEKFSTFYESIILTCRAETGLSPEEKKKALMLLVDKYSPDHPEKGSRYVDAAVKGTEIIRLDIIEWSGKKK